FLLNFVDNSKVYLNELWANLKEGWSNSKEWSKGFFETVGNWIESFKQTFGSTFDFILGILETICDFITRISFADMFKAGTFTVLLIYGKKLIGMFGELKEKVMDFLGLG